MSGFGADTDLGRLARGTRVADIDIVVANSESSTRSNPHSNVVAASAVAKEGINAVGRVAAAADVA